MKVNTNWMPGPEPPEMREIKGPRVWDDVLGKMLYSKFEQYDDSIGFRFSEHLETESPVYMWPSGLKDKNGKEIYEGDVIRKLAWGYIARSEIHDFDEFLRTEKVVSYEEDGDYISYYYEFGRDVVTLERFRFWLKDESFGYEGEDLWEPESCEVIGNIYENPELLK